jgi:hypothetical protein
VVQIEQQVRENWADNLYLSGSCSRTKRTPPLQRLHTPAHRAHLKISDWPRRRGESALRRGGGIPVRAVEEHDGSGVTGLEELSIRGRLNGVPRPRAAGSCRHLQPRPSPSSSGLRR